VNGATDNLLGLKENVIIGRLIPARLDNTEEGRIRLGLPLIPEELRLIDGTSKGFDDNNGQDEKAEGLRPEDLGVVVDLGTQEKSSKADPVPDSPADEGLEDDTSAVES
jgi:hypothetical protein